MQQSTYWIVVLGQRHGLEVFGEENIGQTPTEESTQNVGCRSGSKLHPTVLQLSSNGQIQKHGRIEYGAYATEARPAEEGGNDKGQAGGEVSHPMALGGGQQFVGYRGRTDEHGQGRGEEFRCELGREGVGGHVSEYIFFVLEYQLCMRCESLLL